ncbi:PIR Superfamily Protein [Plasmodium ovale curtisi]|uniref:PIR Superfamily Protein n=1 Tax=Plasmodium ovale curtisi TaxID=864141 RepID=A0A1A8WWM4_PLAOA|nr:PIR Superfamily Protein [Plasmodium ovale curtisi]
MSSSHGYEYCPHNEYNEFKNILESFNTIANDGYNQACFDIFNETIRGNQKLLGYFKQLKQYLEKYKNNTSCKTSNCCRYINYWLNDKVRNLYDLNRNDFHLFQKYAKCEEHKETFKCTSDIYLLSEEEFQSVNELYELYDAYYAYISVKNNSNVSCDYANKFTNKHNNLVYKCNYKENNNMCNEIKTVTELFETNLVETSKVCGRKLTKLLTIPDAYATEKIKVSEFLRSISPMPVFPSIIGISLTLLFLYKFTPIGSLLLGKINKNKIISSNLQDQTQEFLYNSEEENSNYKKRRYNISYKSVDYS